MVRFLTIIPGLVFLGLMGFFWWQLRGLVHYHFVTNWNQYPTPTQTFETRSFKTTDGMTIYAWYVPVKNPKAVVILAHGLNPDGGKAEWSNFSKVLNEAGYSAMLVDLRGNGQSEGDRSYLGTREWQDLAAAYDDVKKLPENKDVKIGFLGKSIGGAAAIMTTGKTGKGDFVIAVAPYLNHQKIWAQKLVNLGLPEILSPVYGLAANLELGWDYSNFRPDRFIKNIRVPVFIIWPTTDNVIGINQGKKLFEMANAPKTGWETNTTHNVIGETGEEFNLRVLKFLGGL